MSDDNTISIPQGRAALQQLKDTLSQQFGQIPGGPVSDMIDKRLDAISDALTKLNQAEMSSGTVAINAAATGMKNPIKNLNALKDQIQSISDDVGRAAEVLGGVDQFISGVKACFGV